ncbi:MAG: hypothetical protein E6I24_12845 [Chloroflexi bacterium]|nr:MAG: hypothetical protein E6I24_12845 [Chloroflexota bacterium]
MTFTPTASGTRTGSVTIDDSATGSPHQLRLTGYSFAFKAAHTLDGWGGLHADGGTPPLTDSAYWPGWKIARSAALLPDASAGYVLDGYGGVHTAGTIANVPTAYFGFDIARDIVFLPTATAANPQGYTLDGWGGIHPFGGAPAISGGGYWPFWDIARAVRYSQDSTAANPMGWTLDGWGGIHSAAPSGPVGPSPATSHSPREAPPRTLPG